MRAGTLPPSYANFTQIQYLNFPNNSLTGTLPLDYGQGAMAGLVSIWLSNNSVRPRVCICAHLLSTSAS